MGKNQLKGGAILTYVTLLVGNAIALVYTPFMLKTLGQSEFGLYSLAHSVVGYLTILDFGFGSATIRYTAKYRAEGQEEKAQTMYGMFIVLYALIGVLTFLIGLFLALNAENLFNKGLTPDEIITVKKLLILASINLAVSFPFGVFTSIITAYEKFIFLKISSLVRHIVNPLVYIPVLFLGYKSVGLIISITILNFIFLSINLIYCFAKLKIKIIFKKFDFKLLKEIFGYSVWVFIASIVNQLWWNAGQFLLGMFASSVAIAIYSLGMQFRSYFESFATAITGVFLPRMTAMDTKEATNKEFTDYFIKVGRLQYIIIALITTGFILFGKQFICVWAGSEYIQAYYITIMIFIPLALVDTQTLGITILQAKNKHKFRSLLYLCVAIACIILCIPFIKMWGAFGCALATALSLTIGNIFIMNWYYHKKIGLNVFSFWKEILKMTPGIILICGLMFLVLKKLPELNSYRKLLPVILVYSLLYTVTLYFLSFNTYERNLVKGFIRKLIKRGRKNDSDK